MNPKFPTSAMLPNPDASRIMPDAGTEMTASAYSWIFIEHAFELPESGNPEIRPPHWRQPPEQSLDYQLANGPWQQPNAAWHSVNPHGRVDAA